MPNNLNSISQIDPYKLYWLLSVCSLELFRNFGRKSRTSPLKRVASLDHFFIFVKAFGVVGSFFHICQSFWDLRKLFVLWDWVLCFSLLFEFRIGKLTHFSIDINYLSRICRFYSYGKVLLALILCIFAFCLLFLFFVCFLVLRNWFKSHWRST